MTPLKARPDAVRKTPQQGAERRAGPRHGPVISGDPEMDLSRGRSPGAAFRTSACRRSAPLVFFRGAETTKGTPAPCLNRAAELWLMQDLPRHPHAGSREEFQGSRGAKGV